MKRIVKSIIFCLPVFLPALAQAEGFEFDHSVKIRGYYGMMDTKKKASHNNMPNRPVSRSDAKLSGEYEFNDDYKFGVYNNSSLIFKDEDNNYPNGEIRFYNYGTFYSPYGQVSFGQMYNVAMQFHMGAKDLGPLSIEDSNLTYFLSNPNWKNGKKSVSYKTPNSTGMMPDGRSLKFSYVTPKLFDNTLLGFTYTPNNPNRRGTESRYNDYPHDDAYVFGMHNEWDLGFADMYTSAGYGIFNRTDKDMTLGVNLTRGNWSLGTGYRKTYVDGNKNPITTTSVNPKRPALYDNYRESQAWDFSIGYEIGPVKTSIAYLYTKAENTSNRDDLVVWSNSYAVNKWVDIYAIGGYLNSQGANKQDSNRNKGYAGIMGVGINF